MNGWEQLVAIVIVCFVAAWMTVTICDAWRRKR